MNNEFGVQVVVWAILLTIFIGLPALLRRSRIRSWHRNQAGACARCGTPLDTTPGGYMEGFRICSRCAHLDRRSTIVAVTFLVLLGVVGILAVGLGALSDARRGLFGPWWVYVLAGGS